MSETLCDIHNFEWKVVPAGVSRKTGKPYASFRVCSVEGCTQRPPSAQKPFTGHPATSQGVSIEEFRRVIQDELAFVREDNRRILNGLVQIWKLLSKGEVIDPSEIPDDLGKEKENV